MNEVTVLKAITIKEFGSPANLQVAKLDLRRLEANEVRVRVHAAGVNPSDVYTTTGTYMNKPQLPYTPGLDGAGVVEEVGMNVTHVNVGDRVFIAGRMALTSGTVAEEAICDASVVFPLPNSISFEQGAALGIPAFTAHYALRHKANVQAGQTVFIHGGSGAVGLCAIQIAKSLGATVIATASRETGKQLVQQAGADIVLDHVTEATVEEALFTIGDTPDVIIEFLANENLAVDLQLIAKYGTIVVVGNRGDITINPRAIMQKECNVTGMVVFNASDTHVQAMAEELTSLMEAGKLVPVIGQTYAMEQANEAFAAVIEGKHNGKVVITL